MTAYRLAIGPVPAALGTLFEVLHIEADGQVARAGGDSLQDALQRLDADPLANTPWCAAPDLVAAAGPGVADVGEPRNHAQSAAAFRHLAHLSMLDHELDCKDDKIVHGLFAAFAALTTMKAVLPPGTSRPFRFECDGVYDVRGHVLFSVAENQFTCLAMGKEEDLRVIYEAGLSDSLASLDVVGVVGAVISNEPAWLAEAMTTLTGQSFAPDLFVWLHGEPSPLGFKSALLLSLLVSVGPAAFMNAGPTQSDVRVPAGRARVSLTPLTL